MYAQIILIFGENHLELFLVKPVSLHLCFAPITKYLMPMSWSDYHLGVDSRHQYRYILHRQCPSGCFFCFSCPCRTGVEIYALHQLTAAGCILLVALQPRTTKFWDTSQTYAVNQLPRLYDCNPSGIPTTWACDPKKYSDGICHENCGAIDFDCDDFRKLK